MGRDAGVLKIRDGRWKGMLAFKCRREVGRDAGVLKIRDGRWEGMLAF